MPNIAPPRNVIYYDDHTYPLSDIANTAYTDVIVGFLVPMQNPNGSWVVNPVGSGGDGGGAGQSIVLQLQPPDDGNLSSNIQMLRNQGKNVLISVGGADGWFSQNASPQNAYVNYSEFVEGLALQIVDIVVGYGFNGVDIDYEDNPGFDGTGGYNGVQFLVDLTSNLFARLTPERFIITHAPQTPYWNASQWTNGAYVSVWQRVGGQITWFNNQFYNQGDYNNALKYYPQFANFVPPQKLLVGALLQPDPAAGYIGPGGMTSVITQLKQNPNIGGNFGGAMGWNFTYDTKYQNGTWGSQIAQALGGGSPIPAPPPPPTPVPTPGSWNVNDLTEATKAPTAAGNPNGYVFTANGMSGMHVVYRGIDGHIYELYWLNGDWNVNDLTMATSAPAAAGDPNGYVFTANGVSGMHVVYRGIDSHIYELYWQNGDWHVNDLTAATNAPAAAGDPNGYMFTANGVSGMHVVYRGSDDDIHELYWQNGDWNVNDLTMATSAPAAAGDPNGYMFTANGVSGMHVVYRGFDDDIHELYWQNGDWHVNDLTAATSAPAAAGDPNGYMFTANGVSGMHVVYRGVDNDIHELYWQNGDWKVNDLTTATSAPAAAGDPNGYMFTANGVSGMHVVYRGADNDIHELYWLNGDWKVNDLTAAKNAPAAAGNPNGYMFTANGVSGMHVVYPSADGHIQEFWWAPS